MAVHTFGEFQRINPHLHVIATDGCFSETGTFNVAPTAKTADVQELFRHEVFKMLKAEGKITDAVIENMMGWRHSGSTIWPDAPEAIEDLARYIVRACFSQERMAYIPAADTADANAKVIYSSKDHRESQTFNALDWLAQLVTHIPNKGESRRWRVFGITAIIPTKPGGCVKRRNVTTIARRWSIHPCRPRSGAKIGHG